MLHNYNGEEITLDNPIVQAVSRAAGSVAIGPYGSDLLIKYFWSWTTSPVYPYIALFCSIQSVIDGIDGKDYTVTAFIAMGLFSVLNVMLLLLCAR